MSASLILGRQPGARGAGWVWMCPEVAAALHSSVDPDHRPLTLSQVRICGAGRSRIPQASAHRSDTLSYHEPEKKNNCLLASIWQEPRGLRACPTSNPSGPAQPTGMRPRAPRIRRQGSLTLHLHRVWEDRAHQDHQEASGGGRALRRQHLAPRH